MRYLITGHKGDIGSSLVSLLKVNGHDVIPLDLGTHEKADRILHLAAKSFPADNEQILSSNIIFHNNVVSYAEQIGVKELIFFSAASVYGNQSVCNLAEDSPLHNPSFYGLSKLCGERMLEVSSLNALVFRLPAVLSLRNQTNFMCRTFRKLQNNDKVTVYNASKVFNNYVSIESIFRFINSLTFRKKFDCINLASQQEKTIEQVVLELRELMNSRSDVIISDKPKEFFNLSTSKAKNEYKFIPEHWDEFVPNWLIKRTAQLL